MVVLSNLEVLNANMIENGLTQKERLEILNNTAIKQLKLLINDKNIIQIEKYYNNKKIGMDKNLLK